ncbi:MAG: hypothetical protein PHQ46_06785 [Negativicutes bacterium]|nr:hypothetical protein [Negativicutes bacterium]
MAKENIYENQIVSYSPTYESDFAPQLPDEQVSSAQSIRQTKIDRTQLS